MKTVLFAIVAVAIFAFATPNIYAERSVIEVPFEVNETNCWFDTEAIIYHCTWEGNSKTVTKQGIIDSGVIAPEQILAESKESHDESKAKIKEDKRTPTEKKIDDLIKESESGTISSANRILLDLLVDMTDACELGIEHGERIQKYAQFELPASDPRTAYKSIDFGINAQLGKIIKKIEECKACDKYRVDVLGQRYLDIVVDDSTSQGYHSDIAENRTLYPHPKLTKKSFEIEQDKAKKAICHASFYDFHFKKELGCPNSSVKKIDGSGITFNDNPAYKAWKQYMTTGGNIDIETLKKKEVKRSHQESLESFAQKHGIDLADLKNLVQGDKP